MRVRVSTEWWENGRTSPSTAPEAPMWISALLALTLSSSTAQAASCGGYLRAAQAARGNALGPAFSRLAKCDTGEAEAAFDSLLPNATTVNALVLLCRAAIEGDAWTPAWKVLSHEALGWDVRDQVAEQIGAQCTSSPKIVAFLKGAYFGLRDIQFQQWDDALIGCQSDDLATWIATQTESPPDSMFDDKYNALMSVLVARQGVQALPHLGIAAKKAVARGPFDAILMQMEAAVQPGIGEPIRPEHKVALESTLVEIARTVPREKARTVADRLANAGSTEAAARLLPTVYPSRVKPNGTFEYGAASIERAKCDGEKKAVIHTATVIEPGRRWIILGDVREPLQAFKARLSKCTSEGDWAVTTTPEPVSNAKEITGWVDGLVEQWSGKGYEVTTRSEKTIILD